MKNKFYAFVSDNKKDLFYVFLLFMILLVISIPKLFSQYHIGIGNWDTYLYLNNGRSFASMGWSDVASIAPVLPYILSLFFRINGSPYQEAIFNVDVIFYIVGVIALYLILRFRFNNNTSFVGSIVYATFTLLYSWVAIGGNDIIGVSLTLLTIYLLLLSHRVDNRYYYLMFIIAAYAFLSRYTAGVMIFGILFYLLVNKISKVEFISVIKGAIVGVISISPFLYHFYRCLGTPFPFLGQFSGTVSNTKVIDSGFLPDSLYYIKNLPQYIMSSIPEHSTFDSLVNPSVNIPSVFAYIFILLMIMGVIVIIYNICRDIQESDENINTRNNRLLFIFAIILGVICLVTVTNISYILTILIYFIALYLVWYILQNVGIHDLDYDFLMLSLFVVYLVFQSVLYTKNDRYFITVLPFIAYFITLSLNHIYKYLDSKISIKRVKLSSVISFIIVLCLVANSLAYVGEIPERNHFDDVEESCLWLMNYDSNINNTTIIYSDNWPAVSWYLNVFCNRAVIEDDDVDTFMYGLTVKNKNKTVDYYIDTHNPIKYDYPSLTKLERLTDVQIYENTYINDTKYMHSSEYYEKMLNTLNTSGNLE